ncbi:Crp/Fnr family transcriptional regulator [Brevibacillus daliensis]|uniref:Crp/Fnr family transcriptional regulator n=1 Tax=Brevibacillus daliensis TaxID=2892995 RepID=UPI001E5261D0|nr:Crp/Fnr family transcriptional regulator [Brevibacillus daliensis]
MINDLARVPVFSDIPEDDLKKIAPLFKERVFKKNHILMFENDPCEEIYILRSGMVKIYRIHDGKEVTLGLALAGDIIGEIEMLSDGEHRVATIEVLEPIKAWLLTKKDFLFIVNEYPSVIRKAYKTLANRSRLLNRMIRYMTFCDVRTKTANLIMDLYCNFGDENATIINFKINQSLFASMVGVTRESISKTMSDFQSEGLIDVKQKQIYLLDIERLETLCDDTEEIPELRRWYDM